MRRRVHPVVSDFLSTRAKRRPSKVCIARTLTVRVGSGWHGFKTLSGLVPIINTEPCLGSPPQPPRIPLYLAKTTSLDVVKAAHLSSTASPDTRSNQSDLFSLAKLMLVCQRFGHALTDSLVHVLLSSPLAVLELLFHQFLSNAIERRYEDL